LGKLIKAQKICYVGINNIVHIVLYISAEKAHTVRLSPGPEYEELPANWQNLLVERLYNIKDIFKASSYDISIHEDGLTLHDHESKEISFESFEIVRKVATSVSLKGLMSTPVAIKTIRSILCKAEIYFNSEELQAKFIFLDLWDQNIENVELDLSLCESNRIITIANIEANGEDDNILHDVVDKVLETISEYAPAS